VHAVGFAYAAQEAGVLPCEATDLRLDAIVTEEAVVACAATDRAAPGA
jgi:5-formyltetrahydrofolate cyclo-ligase